jgi:Flp pilus assembly pilin Flp
MENNKKGTGLKRCLSDFLMEEDGIGTVEVILILVVLIGIVIIFKDKITKLVNSIFKTINSNVKQI